MEVLCVEQIAYCILRLARAKLLEREQFTAVLHPPKTVNHPGSMTPDKESWGWIEILDSGRPARVSTDDLDKINRKVIRYETSIETKLNRWWNLLERLQSRSEVTRARLRAQLILTCTRVSPRWLRSVILTNHNSLFRILVDQQPLAHFSCLDVSLI